MQAARRGDWINLKSGHEADALPQPGERCLRLKKGAIAVQ